MIRTKVSEKHILKQDRIQKIRRLDMLQKDEKVVFKLLKYFNKRLLSFAWKANKYYTVKLIILTLLIVGLEGLVIYSNLEQNVM